MGGEEITRKVRVSLARSICADFPTSGNKNVVFFSGTGSESFTYFSSSSEKKVIGGWWEVRVTFLLLPFSKNKILTVVRLPILVSPDPIRWKP